MKVDYFRMSKLGNRESDYEDSFSYDLEKMKFAIADGVSNSIFSDVWAEALTETFVSGRTDLFSSSAGDIMHHLIVEARKRWYGSVKWDSLPWFTRNKAVNGSHSTLLLCQLRHQDDDTLQMRAIAVGDSCLFKLRGDDIIYSFPLSDPSQFNTTPDLVWSGKGHPFPVDSSSRDPEVRIMDGAVSAYDRLVFATDSISVLLLKDAHPASLLEQLVEKKLSRNIVEAIDRGRIRNDDITVAVVGFK